MLMYDLSLFFSFFFSLLVSKYVGTVVGTSHVSPGHSPPTRTSSDGTRAHKYTPSPRRTVRLPPVPHDSRRHLCAHAVGCIAAPEPARWHPRATAICSALHHLCKQ